ncbi:MAG: phosphatidate cytidylyltransferase [Nannocystaceae bacterium]
MSNLAQRLATAAVLVPILIISLYVDPTAWSILGLAALAQALAHDEFLRMGLPVKAGERAAGLRAVVLACGLAIVLLSTALGPAILLPMLLVSALLIGTTILLRKHALQHAARHLAVCLGSILYVSVLASLWPMIKADQLGTTGASWLLVTLAIAFGSDTVAYFFGRAWGKHKLYPAVSPKKTWEGSMGGLVGGMLATCGFGSLWLLPELPLYHAIPLGILGSSAGQVGDLVESMCKRGYGVKDSGNLLPGHGGMLDRIDALLFVAPVIYLYLWLMQG